MALIVFIHFYSASHSLNRSEATYDFIYLDLPIETELAHALILKVESMGLYHVSGIARAWIYTLTYCACRLSVVYMCLHAWVGVERFGRIP